MTSHTTLLSETEILQARVEALEFALSALIASQSGTEKLQEAFKVQRELIALLVDDPTYLTSREHRQLVSSQFTELMWGAWDRTQSPAQ